MTIADQVGDGKQFKVMDGSKVLQLRSPGHCPVRIHNFTDDASGLQAGQAGQVDRALSLATPCQDALRTSTKRKNMSWPREVVWLGPGIQRFLNREGAIGRADAGADTVDGVDRDRERGAVECVGIVDHER